LLEEHFFRDEIVCGITIQILFINLKEVGFTLGEIALRHRLLYLTGSEIMILIVEPNQQSKVEVCDLMKWADGRCKIVCVDDATEALETTRSRTPTLVICNPVLPDMTGSDLCVQLRGHSSSGVYVAYSNEPAQNLPRIFDLSLPKPPTRLSILQCIQRARTIRRTLKHMRSEERVGHNRKRMRDTQAPNSTGRVTVYVGLVTDPGELTFAVPISAGSTVTDLLKQLGKSDVASCLLDRNGSIKQVVNSEELLNKDKILLNLNGVGPKLTNGPIMDAFAAH
jgi:CheY-like chemotaxis protein